MIITEPAKEIPVVEEVDVCVLGGSCTGVFAAVRAARLGAKVAIVEKQNCFGGAATAALVNVWHTLYDIDFKNQIIAGLTAEVLDRLKRRQAVYKTEETRNAYNLNTEELKIELDELIKEAGVIPYLHTYYTAPHLKDEHLEAVFIENKSGRQAIKAQVFIDATGDGDLCRDLQLDNYVRPYLQPPTTCAKFYGLKQVGDFNLDKAIQEHHEQFGLDEDWGWSTFIPNMEKLRMHAETHVFDINCAEAEQLSYGEIEARRQVRAVMDIIREYAPEGKKIALADIAATIGIRESRHIKTQYRLKEDDLLRGREFGDTIAYGTYPVDIHHGNHDGITLKHLDGRKEYIRRGYPVKESQWREKDMKPAKFYQIPYRTLIPGKYDNLLLAGRMLDADPGAFGAVRVMVNLNQLGEAAGVGAFLALNSDQPVQDIDIKLLRRTLRNGGSIII